MKGERKIFLNMHVGGMWGFPEKLLSNKMCKLVKCTHNVKRWHNDVVTFTKHTCVPAQVDEW